MLFHVFTEMTMEDSSHQVKRFMNLESTEMKMQVYTFLYARNVVLYEILRSFCVFVG